LFECRAYNVELQCLNDFIDKNCAVGGGPVTPSSGATEACCQTLLQEYETDKSRANDYCGKVSSSMIMPCGLYLSSADSAPVQPSDAVPSDAVSSDAVSSDAVPSDAVPSESQAADTANGTSIENPPPLTVG
jgi:hypothetical protein